MRITKIFLLFFISIITFVHSYKILGIFPFNGKSHHVMFSALMKGLAERGHKVDEITHFPLQNPPDNYKVVVNLNGTVDRMVNSFTIDFVTTLSGNIAHFVGGKYGNKLCELIKLEEMQRFIRNLQKRPSYDLVITEAFGAHCYMGFGHILKVPVIAISTSTEYPWITEFIGNDDNLAYVPSTGMTNFNKKNFFQRLQNVLNYHWNVYIFHKTTGEIQTDIMRKYMSPDIPNIRDVERNVALMFVNRHPLIDEIKPVTSSYVEVSGLHIEESNTILPPDLKKWLDESTDGVIYFTFGSLILIETLPSETIVEIYKSFSKKAPIRVLMKIADDSKLPPGLPDNVLISSWIPQQAVLNHKNVLVFMTHGGLMGCQEALYFGVPLIGIPLFGDQYRNIATFAAKNMAVRMDYNNITTASLDEALDKVLTDTKYRKNSKHFSKLFKDRPISAMDTVIYWIEYVIRHGADTFKSPALELTWWQLALLDVYGFLCLVLVFIAITVYIIAKNLLRKILVKIIRKTKVQ